MKNWRSIPIFWRFFDVYLIAAILILIWGVITGADIIIIVIYMVFYGMPVLLVIGFILGVFNFFRRRHDKPTQPMPRDISANDFKGMGKEIGDLAKSAIKHSFLFFR